MCNRQSQHATLSELDFRCVPLEQHISQDGPNSKNWISQGCMMIGRDYQASSSCRPAEVDGGRFHQWLLISCLRVIIGCGRRSLNWWLSARQQYKPSKWKCMTMVPQNNFSQFLPLQYLILNTEIILTYVTLVIKYVCVCVCVIFSGFQWVVMVRFEITPDLIKQGFVLVIFHVWGVNRSVLMLRCL